MHRLFNPIRGEIVTGDESNEPWSAAAVDAFKAKRRSARIVSRRLFNIVIGLSLSFFALVCGIGCWVLWLGKLVMR